MTPLEMMKALHDVPEDLIDAQDFICHTEEDSEALTAIQLKSTAPAPEQRSMRTEGNPPRKEYGITLLPYLLTAGCTAACIAGFGLMIRFSMGNEIVGTQSEIPISVQESVSSMTTAVSTGERAVLTAITETHTVQQTVTVTAEDRTEPVSVTETDAVTEPAAITETLAAVTAAQTEPLPLTETTAVPELPAETTAVDVLDSSMTEDGTAHSADAITNEPSAPVCETGDKDMDAILDDRDKMTEFGFSDEMITALRDSEPVKPIRIFAYVNMKKGFNVSDLLPSDGGTMQTSIAFHSDFVSCNGYVGGPSSAFSAADFDASTGMIHISFGTGGYSILMNTLNTNLFRGKYTYSGTAHPYTDMISVQRPDVTNPSALSDSQIDSCFEYGVIGAGDVNGDGFISSADVTRILRYDSCYNHAGLIPDGTTTLMLAAGDVNCDGAVDIADAHAVADHLADPANSSYYFW